MARYDGDSNPGDAVSQPLNAFVHHALQQGLARPQIVEALTKGGWSAQEIQEALDQYVETDFPLPVPRKRASMSPREAFLFLMLFSALYTWMFALGSVAFDLLNLGMPEVGEYFGRAITSLRAGIASVVVAFPLFLFLDQQARRELQRDPGQRISPIRRWLTYLTLFAAATAIVSDLITLILTFLGGEITLRFALKALVVALLSGPAFGHYLRQLRRDEQEPERQIALRSWGRWAVSLGVVTILGIALWNVGSPLRARLYHQDEQRLQDLRAIRSSIIQYVDEHGELPRDLAACDVNPGTAIDCKLDPVTREPYRYRVLDKDHAELGATFALPPFPAQGEDAYWKHGRGPATFLIEVTRKEAQ